MNRIELIQKIKDQLGTFISLESVNYNYESGIFDNRWKYIIVLSPTSNSDWNEDEKIKQKIMDIHPLELPIAFNVIKKYDKLQSLLKEGTLIQFFTFRSYTDSVSGKIDFSDHKEWIDGEIIYLDSDNISIVLKETIKIGCDKIVQKGTLLSLVKKDIFNIGWGTTEKHIRLLL